MGTFQVGAQDLIVGQAVGSYRIRAKVGQGGMGAVYLAEHPIIGRRAAIKVILPELSRNAGLLGRFHNEARAAAQLRHPAFVDVFDFGTLADGSAYLVMDFLEGESLATCLGRAGRLPVATTLRLSRQIAVAGAVAHEHGIVHRDLKPDNVFLTPNPDGSGSVLVKLLDFGVAKLIQHDGDAVRPATRTGTMLGTPLYMAPEQCRGTGTVDHRADIYSLGCLIHAMLTGNPPFPLEGVGEVVGAHIYKDPPGIREIDSSLPAVVESWVLTMLAKKMDERPASMRAVVARIDELVAALASGAGASVVSLESLGVVPPGARDAYPARDGRTMVLPDERRDSAPLAPNSMTGAIATTTPAVATTTLGQSAAVVTPPDRGERRGRRYATSITAGLVGAVLLSAGALYWGTRRPPRRIRVPVAAEVLEPPPIADDQPTTESARPPAAAATAVPQKEAAPEPPAIVHLKIESTPPGATVTDVRAHKILGKTPLAVSLERRTGMLDLTVEKVGFVARSAKLSLEEDGQTTLKLTRRVTPGPKPPPEPKPSADPQARRKL